jgi:hypothetical protein
MNAALQQQPMKRWPHYLALSLLFVYCTILLVNPPKWVPIVLQNLSHDARGQVSHAIHRSVAAIAGAKLPRELIDATYFLCIAAFLPVCVARIAGRRLYDLGWRWPNRLALRYFIVALAVSAPFLIWMVKSPTIATPYLKQLNRLGFIAFAAYYLVNMFTEHLLLHGVVLGLARPDGHWPDAAPLPAPGRGFIGLLRWLGLAMPTPLPSREKGRDEGENTRSLWPFRNSRLTDMRAWLGLAPGCLIPMVFSALLFGMVHLGKDTRELLLAFPGGLAQAYIAYRSNSWFTPFLIHLATASMALAMMAWM